MIVFQKRGLGEYVSGSIAGAATRMAVEVLYSIQKAEHTTFDNPLPVSMVIVPQGTSEQSKNDLKGFIQRIFNNRPRSTPEYRVMPVYEGTSIERISLTPSELSFNETRTPNAEAVIAAHRVPLHEVFGNAANYATAKENTMDFISRIGARLDYIAEELMYDDEFAALGWELQFHPERHRAMQQDEAEKSSAFVAWVSGGLTPEAALYQVGDTVDEFP